MYVSVSSAFVDPPSFPNVTLFYDECEPERRCQFGASNDQQVRGGWWHFPCSSIWSHF